MRYQEQSPATAAYEAGLGRAATRSKVESDEIEGVGALIHPQPGEFDHLSPLRRLACDVPSEIGRRACEDHRAQVDDPLLDRRIGKGCIGFLTEQVDDFNGGARRRAEGESAVYFINGARLHDRREGWTVRERF